MRGDAAPVYSVLVAYVLYVLLLYRLVRTTFILRQSRP
jgi:hypothetical protein